MNEENNSNGSKFMDTLSRVLNTDINGKVSELKENLSDMSWGSVEITIETRSILVLCGSLTVSVALVMLLWYFLKSR